MLIREVQPKRETSPGTYGFLAGLLVLLLAAFANAGCAHTPDAVASVQADTSDASAATPASAVFLRQRDIINAMREMYPSVEADVMWRPCEQENGYYYIGAKRIELCTEFEGSPGAAVFVAAHEFAHAVTYQMLSTGGEGDADEIAAISMIDAGFTEDVMTAALWWKEHKRQTQIPGDSHPAAGFRAWELLCVAVGAAEPDEYPHCADLYRGLRVKWYMRLNLWL